MITEYIPGVLLVIALMAVGVSISMGIIAYINYISELTYREGVMWTSPVAYGNYWLIQVSILHPNPITVSHAWGLRMKVKFITITGVEPGYALACGNYTIMSMYADYCIFIVKAYPIMPLLPNPN